MNETSFLVHRFQPLYLRLDKAGPFRGSVQTIKFMNKQGEPCNFFLFMSDNAAGKTTALEAIAFLLSMLDDTVDWERDVARRYPDWPTAELQFDLLLDVTYEGRRTCSVLSLLAGGVPEGGLFTFDDDRCHAVGADSWRRFGFRRDSLGRGRRVGELDDEIIKALTAQMSVARDVPPEEFEGDTQNNPTLLYFQSTRDMIAPRSNAERSPTRPEVWDYRPVHIFGLDGMQWSSSLGNLLVWLTWLNEERFAAAQQIINQRVFGGRSGKYLEKVKKDPPEAIVSNEGDRHGLYRLSSGEKSLMLLFLRIGTHMTQNTILLIDELELHLHPQWQYDLVDNLKSLLCQHEGLTVIATTHSLSVIERFAHERVEDKLRKGGFVFDRSVDQQDENGE